MSPETALELFEASTFRNWIFKSDYYGSRYEYFANRKLALIPLENGHEHGLAWDYEYLHLINSDIVFNKVTRPAPANPELLVLLGQIKDALQAIASHTVKL